MPSCFLNIRLNPKTAIIPQILVLNKIWVKRFVHTYTSGFTIIFLMNFAGLPPTTVIGETIAPERSFLKMSVIDCVIVVVSLGKDTTGVKSA